jgi:ADP-dependent NAD(P)H-hydrate dehydratase
MTRPISFTYRSLQSLPLEAPGRAQDKNERGRVLAVIGSPEVPGAAILSGEACLRAGAGKIQIALDAQMCPALGMAFPECGVIPLETRACDFESLIEACAKADAVLIGPGLTDGDTTRKVVHTLLSTQSEAALVIDALALNALVDAPPTSRRRVVITPHHGELANMTGKDKSVIDMDPLGSARRVAAQMGCLIVLKDATTHVVAPDGTAWVHQEGVPGLGTSGSGDVLAGMLTGLIASGVDENHAALWSVATHAEAGRKLSNDVAVTGFLARDLLQPIPSLLHPKRSKSA